MRADHVADYQRFARRAEFRLDAATPDLPTNERLARVKAGSVDLARLRPSTSSSAGTC
jgi:hypothetical protein